KTIQKAMQIADTLTDEALRNGSIKKNYEKRGNGGEPSKDRNGREDYKRTRTGNAFATTTNPVSGENMGAVPKCPTCNSHHPPEAPCHACFNCNRPGHFAKDCRVVPRNVNLINARNLIVRACYECGSTDHIKSACPRPTAKGVGIRVADSHTGNHHEDGFMPLETIQRLLVVIGRRSYSGFKGEAFEQERRHFGRYPTSVRVFDDPILFLAGLKPSWEFGQQRLAIIMGDKEMAFRNFIYTEVNDDLDFLPKEPSPGFSTSSPSALVNTELPKVARIKERKCKMRGGSSRPHVKRKLASESSSSRVVRAKTSAYKDDAPILSISDDDEGLPDCLELKDANAYHLKIFAITLPSWKGHSDNQIDLELLDLHDCCYARQAVVDNAFNKRAREFLQVIEKMRGKADVIKARERSREEECYQVTLLTKSKVDSLEVEKARLEAVEASLRREVEELKKDRRDVVSKVVPYATIELVHSDELGRLVGMLVSSAITYGRCRAYEQVAAMKDPIDLSKAKGYRSSYKKEHT
ncbi:putative reverse transcriptase domain-containing protein, partial [Tanacetum coccineum]